MGISRSQLSNCKYNIEIQKNEHWEKYPVAVESFCATIEVKSHSTDGVFRKGTDWYVKCGAKEHDVTYQSNTQKES